MRYAFIALTFGGLLLAAQPSFAQGAALIGPPSVPTHRTTLNIHPQRHELFPIRSSGIFYTPDPSVDIRVDQPDQLSHISTLRGRVTERPPDQAHFYQYNRPFIPVLTIP